MPEETYPNRSVDARNLAICVAIVAAAIFFIWPFADLSYGDDTAYAHVTLNLAHSGRLVYDGWESAMLVLHAYWGALFIKLFGFSFNCLRMSTLPYALGTVGFCYVLVRRAGLPPSSAKFVTLLLGLCPIFLPVAASFMTDVPALFFTFASLYFLSRAVDGELPGARSYSWPVLGTALGLIGGTGRQVVWLAPLVGLPYIAWVRRRTVPFALVSLVAWASVLGIVAASISWFNRQPYVISQQSLFAELKLAFMHPAWEANITARIFLMLLLMSLPVAFPLAAQVMRDTWRGERSARILFFVLFLGLIVALFIHPRLASIPWVASTLNWEGINGTWPLPGRPIVLTRPIRAIVAMVVYATALLLLVHLFRSRGSLKGWFRAVINPRKDQFSFGLLTLFSVIYFVLFVIRAAEIDIFDRYFLVLLPWAATLFFLWRESSNPDPRLLQRATPIAWILLAILAAYGVASTQDWWALARARVIAAERLEKAGVSRTSIDAGFEYNAWTELNLTGRLNSRWVKNPPGAYRPELSQTPSVIPIYRLEYEATAETIPSHFGSVPYFSLLPPFHKRVCIDKISGQLDDAGVMAFRTAAAMRAQTQACRRAAPTLLSQLPARRGL